MRGSDLVITDLNRSAKSLNVMKLLNSNFVLKAVKEKISHSADYENVELNFRNKEEERLSTAEK